MPLASPSADGQAGPAYVPLALAVRRPGQRSVGPGRPRTDQQARPACFWPSLLRADQQARLACRWPWPSVALAGVPLALAVGG